MPQVETQDETQDERTTAVLEVAGLNAWYGRAQVLFDVSFTVIAGEALLVLGRNGAGKSSLMRGLMGLGPRVQGRRRFQGHALTRLPTRRIARLGLGYVPEDRRLFSSLTVAENLAVGCRALSRPAGVQSDLPQATEAWTPDRLYALFPNLATRRHQQAGRLSGGEQQMLAIARCLMGNPSCLLLDEISEGLAPRILLHLQAVLDTLRRNGLSLVLAEQNQGFAQAVGQRCIGLAQGQVAYAGTLDGLSADIDARRRVFGL